MLHHHQWLEIEFEAVAVSLRSARVRRLARCPPRPEPPSSRVSVDVIVAYPSDAERNNVIVNVIVHGSVFASDVSDVTLTVTVTGSRLTP